MNTAVPLQHLRTPFHACVDQQTKINSLISIFYAIHLFIECFRFAPCMSYLTINLLICFLKESHLFIQ